MSYDDIEFLYLPRLLNYKSSARAMEEKLAGVIGGSCPECVLMLEHDHIYTFGSSAEKKNTHIINGITAYPVGRGGKYTYHGPGQRVIWPILNLALPHRKKDIRSYVNALGTWIANVITKLGLPARMICTQAKLGVWVSDNGQEKKIASIGVRLRKWVTSYGIAVNINPDLSKFLEINPCGIEGTKMTSLRAQNIPVTVKEFDEILELEFPKFLKMISSV